VRSDSRSRTRLRRQEQRASPGMELWQLTARLCAPFATAAKIQNDLRILTERLARINDNLARKISSRNEYDKTIQETEAAYAKVRAHSRQSLAPARRARRHLLTRPPSLVCA